MNEWLINWGKEAMLRSFENADREQALKRWILISNICCYPFRSFVCPNEDKQFFESVGAKIEACHDDCSSWHTVQAPEIDLKKEEEAKVKRIKDQDFIDGMLKNFPLNKVESELSKLGELPLIKVRIPDTELLSCPFCGGEAKYETKPRESNVGHYHYVYCKDCGARTDNVDSLMSDDCEGKAKSQWNKRTTSIGLTNCVLQIDNSKKVPVCPNCDSTSVLMFDSDNDICKVCGKVFPGITR